MIFQVCSFEASQSIGRSLPKYSAVLSKALKWEGLNPVVYPVTQGFPEKPGWIRPDRVVVSETRIYHHTSEEMLGYALEHRGSPQHHLSTMADLWVTEYPTPKDDGAIHRVTTNGNHRRLIYLMTGFPLVGSNVQKSDPRGWEVPSNETKHIGFFEFLGLCKLQIDSRRQRFILVDETRCIGWVLPPARLSRWKVPAEVVRRMGNLEQALGEIDNSLVDILRDRARLRKEMWRYIFNEVGRFVIRKGR